MKQMHALARGRTPAWLVAALSFAAVGASHAQVVLTDRSATLNGYTGFQDRYASQPATWVQTNQVVVDASTPLLAPVSSTASTSAMIAHIGESASMAQLATASATSTLLTGVEAGSIRLSEYLMSRTEQPNNTVMLTAYAQARADVQARWDFDILQDVTANVLVLTTVSPDPTGYTTASFNRVLADGSLSAIGSGNDVLLAAGHYVALMTGYAVNWSTSHLYSPLGFRGSDASITITGTFAATAVPEPATVVLMGLGLAGVLAASRRRSVV
jgi:hypothetical protein